jgi:hypothetical protein
VLYTCEVNANLNVKVPGYLEWSGATQSSAIVPEQDILHASGRLWGTHELDQGRDWE